MTKISNAAAILFLTLLSSFDYAGDPHLNTYCVQPLLAQESYPRFADFRCNPSFTHQKENISVLRPET